MKKLRFTFIITVFALISTSLSAQEITSFPSLWGGHFYQDTKELTWKEINTIMSESYAAEMHWQKSKKQMLGGLAFGVANMGSAIWFLVNLDDNKPLTGPIISLVGTAAIGSVFFHAAMNNKKMAILKYNDSLGKTSFRLVPTGNENGLGLALKF